MLCNAMGLFYDCSKLCTPSRDTTITASVVTISRFGFQEAIKILDFEWPSTKCQSIDGYFCNNIVYPKKIFYCYYVSHVRTKLSRPEE